MVLGLGKKSAVESPVEEEGSRPLADEDVPDTLPEVETEDLPLPLPSAKEVVLTEIDDLHDQLSRNMIVSKADSRDLFIRMLDLIRQVAALS